MAYFSLTFLGVGAALPTLRHRPSAQAVEYRGRVMLFDCGEGTQLQLRKAGISFHKISDIFISHLHGDHFLGLPGLLSTLDLYEFGSTVTIHCFPDGIKFIRQFMGLFGRGSSLDLHYEPIDPKGGIVLDTNAFTVEAFPLEHRIADVGFVMREKPKMRHIDGEAVRFHQIPHYWMKRLQRGEDYVDPDGRVIANVLLTRDADPCKSYAYCSDTAYTESIIPYIKGVDVLYHEATYNNTLEHLAASRGHSTAAQAATIANLADVGDLYIGHFSQRIEDEDAFLMEARAIHPATMLAREGLRVDII